MVLSGSALQSAPAAQALLLRGAVGGSPVSFRVRNPRSLHHPPDPGPKSLCRQGRSDERLLLPLHPLGLSSSSILYNRGGSVVARRSSHNGGLNAGHDDEEEGHSGAQLGSHHHHGHDHEHDHGEHDHNHGEEQHEHSHSHSESHSHSHSHGHSHHGHTHASSSGNLNALQKSVQKLGNVLGLGFLAGLWRDNLKACLASLVLLLLSAAVPYFLPKAVGATVQSALIVPALPLTGVSNSFHSLVSCKPIGCLYKAVSLLIRF
jgi:hypothetical protein